MSKRRTKSWDAHIKNAQLDEHDEPPTKAEARSPRREAAAAFRQLVMCLPRAVRLLSAEKIALIREQLGDAVPTDLTLDGRSKAARSALRPDGSASPKRI